MGSVANNEWCYAVVKPRVLVVFGESLSRKEDPVNLQTRLTTVFKVSTIISYETV